MPPLLEFGRRPADIDTCSGSFTTVDFDSWLLCHCAGVALVLLYRLCPHSGPHAAPARVPAPDQATKSSPTAWRPSGVAPQRRSTPAALCPYLLSAGSTAHAPASESCLLHPLLAYSCTRCRTAVIVAGATIADVYSR